MKQESADRNVQTSGALAQAKFGISMPDSVQLIRILRSHLYTNKPLAVLREYGSNAWDEHIAAGCSKRPIHVTLPSTLDPVLRIRDFGRGLSWEDIDLIYTKYGASTKRDTDEQVGTMGIGCKSAFSYSDSFTVTSWHAGKKSIYVAVLDETDEGRMDKLAEEDSDEESGIEVMIPIRPADIHTFRRTAKWLFYYMTPQPTINIELERATTQWEGEHGFWGTVKDENSYYGYGWYAVMGCVPYKIDLAQITQDNNGSTVGGPPLDEHTVNFLNRNSGCLHFKIREVRISANREEVEYTDDTIGALKKKVRALMEEMLLDTSRKIRGADMTPWDRRRQARQYERDTQLKLPGTYHDLASDIIEIYPKDDDKKRPKAFHLYDIDLTKNDTYRSLRRTREVRLDAPFILIRDLNRSIRPYVLDTPMVVAVPDGKKLDVAKVEAELAKVLKAADLTGIPIRRMSDMREEVEEAEEERLKLEKEANYVNPKHKERYFVLNENLRTKPPFSDNWDIVERVPTDDDVFVVLHRFEPKGIQSLQGAITRTQSVMKFMGVDMPPIYGVKHTMKNPVFAADVPGMPFLEWRGKVIADWLESDPEKRKLLDTWHWAQMFSDTYFQSYNVPKILPYLREHLDGRHSIIRLLSRYRKASLAINKLKKPERDALSRCASMVKGKDKARRAIPAKNLKRVLDRYPLLTTEGNSWAFEVFLPDDGFHSKNNHRPHWLQYVQLMDKEAKS